MKILFCEMCRTATSAGPQINQVRRCYCGKSAIWKTGDSKKGATFSVLSKCGPKAVSMIVVADSLLMSPFLLVRKDSPEEYGMIDPPTMKKAIKACLDKTIFRQLRTLVLRIRPSFDQDIQLVTDEATVPVAGDSAVPTAENQPPVETASPEAAA